MPKNNPDVTQQKYHDILVAYNRIAPECRQQADVWKRLAEEPAPRFYISHFQAYQRMLQMYKGDRTINNLSPYRRRLFEALYDKCLELSQKREYCKLSLYQLTSFAITQPAPSFFISPATMPAVVKKARTYDMERRKQFSDFYKRQYLSDNNEKKE